MAIRWHNAATRDHRPDCKQACIGLVDQVRMPLGYRFSRKPRGCHDASKASNVERRYGRAWRHLGGRSRHGVGRQHRLSEAERWIEEGLQRIAAACQNNVNNRWSSRSGWDA